MSGHQQLIIDINRSPQLICLLFCFHGLAVATLTTLSIPLTLTVIIIMLSAFSLSYYIKKTHEVVRVVAQPDNEWLIQTVNGTSFSASLTGSTYISDWLTLLVFTSLDKSSPTCVYLMKDSVAAPVLSQLKLSLKVSSY
jgi:hypothetical protein